jgi:hypothetical protein
MRIFLKLALMLILCPWLALAQKTESISDSDLTAITAGGECWPSMMSPHGLPPMPWSHRSLRKELLADVLREGLTGTGSSYLADSATPKMLS